MGKNLCQLYDRMHEAIDSDLAHIVEPLVSHLPVCEDLVVARLWEMVTFANWTIGGTLWEEVQTYLNFDKYSIACNFWVTYKCSSITKSFSYKLSSLVHKANN